MKLRNKLTGEMVDFTIHKHAGLSDDGYKHDFNSGHIEFYVKNDGDVLNDLDLLFSQEGGDV